jgi:hypothetical protein
MAVLPLLVPRRRLAAQLGTSLTLVPLPGVPALLHPVMIELWRVQGGRVELGDLDAHAWAERGGALAGLVCGATMGALAAVGPGGVATAVRDGLTGRRAGLLGSLCGAVAGGLAGSYTGGALGATIAAGVGAQLAGRVGRWSSEASSNALGTYNEILVSVPGVRAAPWASRVVTDHDPGGSFVLAMHTDSLMAILGERALGWGFGKRLASIERQEVQGYRLRRPGTGSLLLSSQLRGHPRSWCMASEQLGLRPLARRLALPLFGRRGRTTVASYLDRQWDHPAARVAPAAFELQLGEGFAAGLRGGAYRVLPLSARRPWGGFMARGVPVRLSYPRRLAGWSTS